MRGVSRGVTLLMAALLLAVVLLCSCARQGSEVRGTLAVRVGVVAPLTGPAAVWGQWLKQGVSIALREYKAGQSKFDVRVIYEDSQGDPAKAVSAVQKLISVDKVQVVYGPLTSAEVLAVAPIAEKAKVVLLTPSASSRQITSAGRYIFRTYPSDQEQSIALARYCHSKMSARAFGILYKSDDFGQGVKDDFARELRRLGVGRIAVEGFQPGASDFRTSIAKLKQFRPEVTLIVGMPDELGTILRQSRELAFHTRFVSTANIENPEVLKMAGSAADGVVYGSVLYDDTSQVARRFRAEYQGEFKTQDKPGLGVALAHDGMSVLLDAIMRASRPTPTAIGQALGSTHDYPALTGSITFDANGDVVKHFALKAIRQGKFVVLSQRID